MSESAFTKAPDIVIRDIDLLTEMPALEALQREAWGVEDLDVLPLTIFAATKAVGAVLLGAYDGSTLVGFVYGFVGIEHGQIINHSHMLAVKNSYRNLNLGYKLKLAQRDRVLAANINRITWTFDPLQSLNAYFNFQKLGVIADSYKINFYGAATTSFLHQLGTDRLWVSWLLTSERVRQRLVEERPKQNLVEQFAETAALVEVGPNEAPHINSSGIVGQEHLRIEIPVNINRLELEQPQAALKWREATRWAFTEAIAAEYLVEEFFRVTRAGKNVGSYLLSHKKKLDDFS